MFALEEISQDESTFLALSPKHILHLLAPCLVAGPVVPKVFAGKSNPARPAKPIIQFTQPTIQQRLLYLKQILDKISQILKKILETANTRDFQRNNRL
jgi:hypothetical protein